MGAGNWIPTGHSYLERCDGYYVRYEDITGGTDYTDMLDIYIRELIEDIQVHLETTVDGIYALEDEWRDSDELVIAEVGYVKVLMADNQSSLAIYVIHEEIECEEDYDDYKIYMEYYEDTFKNLTNFLKERYPLYIRTGPWTSGLLE